MATKSDVLIPLAGVDFSSFSKDDLKSMYRERLEKGLHGISFSPYIESQQPGTFIPEEQIRERLKIVRPYTNWIRTFSVTDGHEAIPRIAHEAGLKTLVGAWLGTDKKKNEREIENLIKIGKAGEADMIAVGNEVMYRKDLTEDDDILNTTEIQGTGAIDGK